MSELNRMGTARYLCSANREKGDRHLSLRRTSHTAPTLSPTQREHCEATYLLQRAGLILGLLPELFLLSYLVHP